MKKEIKVKVSRKNNRSVLTLKVPKEVENLFKKLSNGQTKTSAVWKQKNGENVDYYVLNKEYEDIERKINPTRYFNDFGNGLIVDEKINLAPLRAVGVSKKITITSAKDDFIPNMELEQYVKELGYFVKNLWENQISERKITAKISFEI